MQLRLPPFAVHLNETEGTPTVPSDIQIIRTGSFYDERYGTVNITKATLASFKKNFDNRVRKIDLAIDFFHDAGGPAAGWIKNLFLSQDENELWASVQWTPSAAKKLADKEVRYVSADFDFHYKDNETRKDFGPTLLGAGLTNRPVVKGMAPAVALTEITERDQMNIEELAAQVKTLSEKLTAVEAKNEALSTELAQTKTELADVKKAPVKATKKTKVELDEMDDGEDEKDGEDETMLDEMEELDSMDADALKAMCKKLMEKNKSMKAGAVTTKRKAKFDTMLSDGKVVEAQREAFMAGDVMKMAEMSQPVKLKAQGGGVTPEEKSGGTVGGTEAQDKVIELAEKMVKDGKAKSLPEATIAVLSENPALSAQYNKETEV